MWRVLIMGKFNFFKLMKYGMAAMSVLQEVNLAFFDGRLTAQEAIKIIRTAVVGADIKGVDVDLIEITGRADGGFTIEFPGAAIKDWNIDFE